jgi:hypothetical protein
MRQHWLFVAAAGALIAGCAQGVAAQPPSATALKVNAVRDGTVRFSFASREGVCSSPNGWTVWNDGYNRNGKRVREVEPQCERGPVRVAVDRSGGRTVAVRTYVGGTWARTAEGPDLGTVPAAEGAEVLLDVAEEAEGKAAEQAMQGVTLADSISAWPRLAALARNASRPASVRKSATFWLAQAAGDKVMATLSEIAEDDPNEDVRKQAVFALSQRPQGEGVPSLMAVAKNPKASPGVRKQAYFWLGQSGDARAVAFLEEALTKP